MKDLDGKNGDPLWRRLRVASGLDLGRAPAAPGVWWGIRWGIGWNVALLAASLVALPLDHRRILGLDPWIKPIKFEISVIVFLFTMALLLTALRGHTRFGRLLTRLDWGFGIAMIVENSIIALQSARGVRSHMNFSTPFDASAFAVMGTFIALNTVLLAILLALFCATRLERPKAEIWGIRLGLAMILAGSLEGVWMVVHGAHTVGAPDGGPGLAFLNWSTRHGDLRIAHFLALHALQLLWFAGYLLGRTNLGARLATAAVALIALLYAGVVWQLFAVAMAGRPLLGL